MKYSEDHASRKTGAAAAFIEDRLAEGRVAFPLSELVAKTGLSVVAANNQLRRLGARVRRVTRPQPFFLIVDAAHRTMGAPPVEWWLDAYFRWLDHPYYLALLSAAESYGAAPQAVQVHQVMTDTPRRQVCVGRVRVRFFVKRGAAKTLVGQPARAYAPLRVSTPEATALDLVKYAARIGGFERARETLVPLLPSLRTRQMRQALDAERNTPSGQRLGYLLEQSGAARLAEAVHEWLPAQPGWRALPGSEQRATRQGKSERWHLFLGDEEAV